MKKRRYEVLREKLYSKDIDQNHLAELLGRSAGYVSSRMSGKKEWTMSEMWKMMDLIEYPAEQFHIVFPRNGITADTTQRSSNPNGGDIIQCLNIAGKVYKLTEVRQ